MSHHRIHFFDAAEPRNVASGVYAAVAIDGDFAWRQEDINRMGYIFRYVVHPTVEKAQFARGVDIEAGNEPGNPTQQVAESMPFLIARHKSHGDATAYCNRSTLSILREAVHKAGITVYEWVATLDGTMDVPGAWAVQFAGGIHSAVDQSVLLGVNNFYKP